MTSFSTIGPSRTFNGKPCVKCGGVLRYVAAKTCVACNGRKYQAYKDRNKDKGRISAAQNRSVVASIKTRQMHSDTAGEEARYRGWPSELKGLEFDEMMAAMKARFALALERTP